MSFLRPVSWLIALLPAALFAAGSPPVTTLSKEPAPKAPKSEGGFVFSLLPKSLQRNPRLSFNVFTEMTAEGRKVPKPTPKQPAYYIAQAGGVYNGGVGAEYSTKAPPVEKLEQLMKNSLAEGGYLPADDASHPPTLVIIYHWGSHSFQPPQDTEGVDADGNAVVTPAMPEIVLRKALLDRAMLLGGVKFTQDVSAAMGQVDQKAALQRNFTPVEGSDFGGSVGDMLPDPFEQLRNRSVEYDRMIDELFSSSFFVVASAYDYAALVKGQRRVLWRTKLTVNSLGVNMLETVPALIATGGAYFGRETETPVVINKRVSRDGRVEVGTPTVVPDPVAPATSPKGAKK
ncbi:MAG: hypothetical protein ABIZ81_05385 [Opitutaceae bacterium]